MALQVWMPFTDGTLKQQGLKNVSPTIGGTVNLTNAGKLGKCATIGTAAGGITLPASSMTSFTECSVAFWIKIISWNSSYATFFQAGLGSTPWNNYIFGILRNNQGSNLCFTLTNSSGSSTSASYTTSNLNLNQWYHLAFTYKAGTVRTYIDGALDKTYNTSYVPNFAGITHISIGRCTNNSGYQTNCNLNDFRLYDHCLSPMEVKKLSQGLVLHYPLNRQGWGQENLYTTSQDFSGSWNNKGNWTTSEEIYQNFIVKQKSTVWGGLSQNIPCSNGDIFTISFYAKVDAGGRICSIHRSSLGNVTTGLTILGGNFISGTDWINATDDGTQWKRYWATVRIDSSDITYLQWRIENSIADKTLYICGMKMERGSIVTPWCPNSSDTLATTMGLNSTIEYDCSGFCNNGTRTGTFSWTSDTPKYAVSQYFNGSSYILTDSGTFSWFGFDKCTVAVWMKPTTTPSSWAGTFGIAHDNSSNNKSFVIGNYGGKFTMQSANGSWVNIQSSNLPINEWHHCVATLDGTTIKMYFDGELVNTYTINWGNTTVASDTRIQVGNDLPGSDEKYVGYYSDARIYATALSADEVKSLYQNCATIDPDGTIRGQIR